MRKELYQIPGKVVGHYHPDIDAIVDTWQSLFVSLDEWKSTIYDIGICDYAPKHRVTTWIIDTSQARSVFPPEVQEFRKNVARKKLEENGVKYLFVVIPDHGIGKFSAAKTAELYDSEGPLRSFEVGNVQEALEILKSETAKPQASPV